MVHRSTRLFLFVFAVLATATTPTRTRATETENLGMRALPAPGVVVVDGKLDDWDLSGGIFVCGDVESAREQVSVWYHVMYDSQNVYVLARWIDPTPLNNPGVTSGDMGFAGDCLQFRVASAMETPREKGSHWTCWRGRDGKDVMDLAYGRKFDGPHVPDARAEGAKQAFTVNADGKGYIQEISIPWKILTQDGQPIPAGGTMVMTVEPNFTVGTNGRLSFKDIFRPNMTLDRVFTFMNSPEWGLLTFAPAGKVEPQPVRLSDAREFAVKLDGGVPRTDWTGLIKSRELTGFKPIALDLPRDGYVSLVIQDSSGKVVRNLLNDTFLTQGKHEVKWDGLTTPNWREPGEPVPAGTYAWSAIQHSGIGLKLVGWACNGGITPWDDPAGKGNWGGDHGLPSTVAVDGKKVYLGWTAAEAGKALLACDLQGNVQWNNTHGGIAGATPVAVDADSATLYAINAAILYRLETKTGTYTSWDGTSSTDLPLKSIFGTVNETPENQISLAVGSGYLYLASRLDNMVAVADGKSGKAVRTFAVPSPSALAVSAGRLYIVSDGKSLLSCDAQADKPTPLISGLQNATSVALDKNGRIYVGVGDPDNQVKVFTPDGKPAATIGRQGGRALLGAWTPDGMRFIHALAVDAEDKLWVMEADGSPKRVSVWDTQSGKFQKEFFGPSGYGALGGAIDPLDPTIMVGQGCEWKLDPGTGHATCLGVITRDQMQVSRFSTGPNNKVYLAVAANWAFDTAPLKIYERVGPADYKLRTTVYYGDKNGREWVAAEHGQAAKPERTIVWSDDNGDGQRQDSEIVSSAPGELRFSAWYMNFGDALTLYSGDGQYKVTGYSACGAPRYAIDHPTKMPATGFGSADGRLVLQGGEYGASHSWMNCFDIASGKKLWAYPDTFVGVHGSHNAPPGEVGLIRGSFNPCASVKLPEPIGNAWIIPTNVGEWHILTEKGFYLTSLFQQDPLKIQWPQAIPGASLDNCPPGMGGEDFGGSATLAADGKLYVQAGKTAFWNAQVTGLDTVKELANGKIEVGADEAKLAQGFREQALQSNASRLSLGIRRATPTFTGDIPKDFAGAQILEFKKQDDAAVKATAAWDDQNVYLAWDVVDNTPWVNGANEAEMMYLGGDTVDFQLGTNPAADKTRAEGVLGDLRLSIGNFQGKPTAVIYRKVAATSHPKTFSSGVVKAYEMQSVTVVPAVRVQVTKRDRGYIVEAAVPLSELRLKPVAGLSLRGDFGVTHGDTAGQRTRLRTYWSNQHTGIVDDAVFELQMEPKNWALIQFVAP